MESAAHGEKRGRMMRTGRAEIRFFSLAEQNTMKKTLLLLLLCLFCLSIRASARADQDTPADIRLSQTASGRGNESVIEISEGWKFGGSGEDAWAEDYPDSKWNTVNLPHTWNVEDAADGDGQYSRTSYWYRKTVNIDASFEGKRVYLEFLGANQQTDVYVNGAHIKLCGSSEYTHKGGYTAFRYDITEAIRIGANIIAIKVDNTYTEEIAPITADFNMYGGIYRRLYLIAVDAVHVDLANSGSSGLFLTTPNVRSLERPDDFGALNIRADIVNEGGFDKRVTITVHIEGDNAPEDIVHACTVPAGGKVWVDENAFIRDPHPWNGIDYSGEKDNSDIGYRYRVTLTIAEGEKILDEVSDMVGFRYFYVDKDTGFYLNGESHPLRGVNRHQFKNEKGNAITETDHELDIQLIMELGANSVRLSHYPQTDYFYDLCDQYGIVVWTEIPLVNAIGTAENFLNTTKTQLTEMIRQQYNRPSIVFWGLQNEVRDNTRSRYYTAKQVIAALDRLARQEDQSGRYTTQAVNHDLVMDEGDPFAMQDNRASNGWKSDLIAWNIYPGWYGSFQGTFEELMNDKSARDSRPMGVSEYGWGASVDQHELYPKLGKNDLLPNGKWHPEEYQNLMHENALAYINEHPNMWATYIWCMFDFDVDSRNEGARAAQNDKGLVTNDRKIKKDSFYLYKANWDRREPFVHITSSRFSERKDPNTYVKVYSNCASVSLYMNGAPLGSMTSMGNGVFMLEDVTLDVGENKMLAVGVMDGEICEDMCIWRRSAFSSVTLKSDTLQVDAAARTVLLTQPLQLKELKKTLVGAENATYTVMLENEEVTDDDAVVSCAMTAFVRSENGQKTAVYSFIPDNMILGKNAWASSNEAGNAPKNAVDGKKKTRWVASNNSFPQRITVDLGETYFLSTLNIDWYDKKDRYYTYTVEVSTDGILYVTAADRRDNKLTGTTSDELRLAEGRYLRINVYSCSDRKGFAAIYDMSVTGWSFSSKAYDVDRQNKLIFVPAAEGLTLEEVFSRFDLRGGVCATFKASETEDSVEGAQIVLTDLQSREIAYTVTTWENAHLYSTDLALYKSVYFSSEEGISLDKKKNTHGYNVNDGVKSTAWVADTRAWGGAIYPEWIGVDLGEICTVNGFELRFETKGERIYHYQILASTYSPLFNYESIAPDFKLVLDQSANVEFNNGHYTFEIDPIKARYVVVVLYGNSLYPTLKNAAAGVYDFKVFGTVYGQE